MLWLTYFDYSHYKCILTQNAQRNSDHAVKHGSREADANSRSRQWESVVPNANIVMDLGYNKDVSYPMPITLAKI